MREADGVAGWREQVKQVIVPPNADVLGIGNAVVVRAKSE